MDEAKRVNMRDLTFYSAAQEILDFTTDLYKNSDENYFIRRLYGEKNMKYVCQAMASRMDLKCFCKKKVWKNNYGRINEQR